MKNYIILTLSMVLFAFQGKAQQTTENYVKTYVAREPIQGELNATTNIDKNKVQQSIQYVDGLGRAKQAVTRWGSPMGKDVIAPITYDQFGRVVKQYLPFVSSSTTNSENVTGNYRSSALTDQNSFYDTFYPNETDAGDYAFSQQAYEASPLSRVLKQGAPGEAWKIDGTHTLDFVFRPNVSADAVKILSVSNDEIQIMDDRNQR